MKLYLCELRNSLSPAIITILLGNFPEPVSKITATFPNESMQQSSAAPPLATIQHKDAYANMSIVHEQNASTDHQQIHANHDDIYTEPSDEFASDEIVNAALVYAIASDDETHALFDEGNKPP